MTMLDEGQVNYKSKDNISLKKFSLISHLVQYLSYFIYFTISYSLDQD